MIGELCEVCGIGKREARRIRHPLLLEDRVVVFENVPAEVCDHCEETTFTAATVDQMQALLWGDARPARTMQAQVYEFSQTAEAPAGPNAGRQNPELEAPTAPAIPAK